VVELRADDMIDDAVLRHMEHELDLEELRKRASGTRASRRSLPCIIRSRT
jgi:hypothetical protein